MAQRRISSLGSSLVASNRWKPALVTLLKTYPTLEIKDLPSKRFTPICDACRIKGRRGCRTGEFSGTPYNRLGFAVIIDQYAREADIFILLCRTSQSRPKTSTQIWTRARTRMRIWTRTPARVQIRRIVQVPKWRLPLVGSVPNGYKSFTKSATGRYVFLPYESFLPFIIRIQYDLFKCILAEVDQLYEVKQSSGVVNLSDVFVPVKYADGKRPEDLHDAVSRVM